MISLPPTRLFSCVITIVLGLLLCAGLAAQPPAHDIALVFDNSGSMKANDPDYMARTAARSFVESLTGDVRLAVIIFDQSVTLAAPLTVIDDQTRGALLASFKRVDYKGQFTNTAKALERAVYELRANGRDGARRSVVVFTDGIVDTDNKARDVESIKWMRDDLAAEAADSGIRVYGIAFTENADVMTIQTLAKRTNAAYYRAPAPTDLAHVFAQLSAVLQAPDPLPAPIPAAVPAPAAAPQPATTETPSSGGDVAPASAAETARNAVVPQATDTAPETTASAAASTSATAAAADATATAVAAQDSAAATSSSIGPTAVTEPEPKPEAKPTIPSVVLTPLPATATDSGNRWLIIALASAVLVASIIALIMVLLRRGRAPAQPSMRAPVANAVPEGVTLEDLDKVTGQSRHALNKRLIIVGRSANPSADGLTQSIVIEQTTIGRQHAVIEYRNNGFWIRDQKSLNGTFVNGERVGDSAVLLKGGDEIRFYDMNFRFQMSAQNDMDRTVFAGAAQNDMDRTVFAGATEEPVANVVAPDHADEAAFTSGDIAAQMTDESVDLVLDAGADEDEYDKTMMFNAAAPQTDRGGSADEDADEYDKTMMFNATAPQTDLGGSADEDADENDKTMIFNTSTPPPGVDDKPSEKPGGSGKRKN